MKFTKIVSVTVTVVVVVVLLFISLKLEVNRRSARDKSIGRDILIKKLKRSLKDDRKNDPSGIESDVDDTRDTDLHDRRELMGDGDINSDYNGGIYRKRRMSEDTDNPDMLDRPSRSEKDVTPSMQEEVTDSMPEILTLPDYRLKNKSSIYIDNSVSNMKTTRETNSADENDDEVDVENNEEGRFKRGFFDDDDDDVEHFFERYKRSSNEVEDNSDSVDDEDSDDDTGDDDGRFRKGISEENIEEDDNEEDDADDDNYLNRQRRESYKNMEDDDEEDDADGNEYLHKQRRESYQNIEDDDEESEHLNRQRRDIYKNANFFHHNGEKTNPAIDTAYVKDVYSEELYNPPYNLVPSIAKKRRSLSTHDTEKIYDNEKEAGEEKDYQKKRRSLSSKNQDIEKIDNEDNIENEEEEVDEDGLKKRDLGDFDEDNDIETEDNEENVEDRKRNADDNDTEESDLKDNDISNVDASDSENTVNNNDGELKKILLTKLKQHKKRNINIKKDLLYDNNHHITTTTKTVNPEQKGQQNKSVLVRKPRNHEKTELIDDIAFDEVDSDPNSGYTQWEEWGPCSLTCGVGRSERRRKCTEQSHCKSGDLEQRVCMTVTCDDDD